MRISFEKADFDALAELWRNFFIEKYHVDSALIKKNTVESPVFDWGASCIEMENDKAVGFVAVKRSANPRLFRGPDPDQAHITALAYRDPNIGIDLMAHSKAVLRDRGVYKLIFGQDSRHFFPGCPTECSSLRDFLIIEGFQEGDEVFDLELDLKQYAAPKESTSILKGAVRQEDGDSTSMGSTQVASGAAEVRPVQEQDLPLLRIFLNREFPGRWSYDVLNKIEAEGKAEFVYGLFIQGACEGFALTQDAAHTLPIGGAVWQNDLGDAWASLGPIGVSKQRRGQGYGDALLAATLESLQKQGARKCIIDWTTLGEFYQRHGFGVARRYRPFTLRLDMNGADDVPSLSFQPE